MEISVYQESQQLMFDIVVNNRHNIYKEKCKVLWEHVTGGSDFSGEVWQDFLEEGMFKQRPEEKVGLGKKSI